MFAPTSAAPLSSLKNDEHKLRFHRSMTRTLRLLLPLVFLVLLPGLRGHTAPQRTPTKAAWTLMIYLDADNTLETPQLSNLKEMLQVGSTDQVQIVVLCDRSPKSEPKDQYTDEAVGELPDWAGTRLLYVEKGRLKPLADWGHASMGDLKTLRRFVDTAASLYPAEHYGLILEDHGSGWSSLCVDETSGDQALTLRDLRAALLPFAQAHGKFDLVGIDACLMGSLETAQALAPTSRLLVGSEELAPARGWNYDAFLNALTNKPDMSGLELARAIVDLYTLHFREANNAAESALTQDVTLSVLDLDRLGLLQSALSNLADLGMAALRGGHPQWIQIARARARSEEYGVSGGADEDEEMHDVIDLAQRLERSDDAALAEAARQVEACAKKVVRYGMRGPLRPHSGGIAVYFPLQGLRAEKPHALAYARDTFAGESRWVHFLGAYGAAVKSFRHKPHLQPFSVAAREATVEHPVPLVTRVSDDDIDKAYFLLLQRFGPDLLVLGRLPAPILGDSSIGHRFSGHWFQLHNRNLAMPCPITDVSPLDETFTHYLADVPVQIRRPGSATWGDVSLTFEITAQHCQLLHAFALTPEGPLQVTLHRGDTRRAVYTLLRANGEAETWTNQKEENMLRIEDPQQFGLGWADMLPGPYLAGFEVVTLAGVPAMQMAEVVWKQP